MFEITTIKDVKLKIGEACKWQRKSNNLTRDELAASLAISRTTIQNIENGKNATLDNLLKVANHFGLLTQILNAISKSMDTDNDISLY